MCLHVYELQKKPKNLMHIQLSICCRCDSLRKPLFHKLISKNVMLVVYINKMHLTAEHKVVHNVEISFNI